jgi:hypothetical protein
MALGGRTCLIFFFFWKFCCYLSDFRWFCSEKLDSNFVGVFGKKMMLCREI